MVQGVLWAAGGTGFAFMMTSLGAATVFLLRRQEGAEHWQRVFLGFAAGVMIAASVWSLLIPAIEEAEAGGFAVPWLPAVGGFLLGGVFMLLVDNLLLRLNSGEAGEARLGGGSQRRSRLLMAAVTLHNIPEGMALGLSFALAAQNDMDPAALGMAMALALGMGIQNFPEGAAVSLPLYREGASAGRAFVLGVVSGVVEPIFGILAVIMAGILGGVMPWLLAFAAGAMIYVVTEELIPEVHIKEVKAKDGHMKEGHMIDGHMIDKQMTEGVGLVGRVNLCEYLHIGTSSVMVGFGMMMLLDVALG